MASGSSHVLPQLPSQAAPTQARVWPHVLLSIRGMKKVLRPEAAGEWRDEANKGGETCPYFLLRLLSRPPPLLITAKAARWAGAELGGHEEARWAGFQEEEET